MDEDNSPVPFARVQIKDSDYLTSTDADGKYNLQVDEGDFEVVYTAVGYEDKVIRVIVKGHENIVQNAYLSYGKQLREAVVKAKKRDPAYDIIDRASKNRAENDKAIGSSRCKVYIKAIENVIYEQKEEDEGLSGTENGNSNVKKNGRNDKKKPQTEEEKIASGTNMAEIILLREYAFPNKIKETREAIRQLGDTRGLYYLTTVVDEFNFYQNLVSVPRLTEAPLISPLNTTAILHYKFKLESTSFENGRFVYKISVKHRTRGNSLVEGDIWIIDTTFAIRRVSLSVVKNNLKGYDRFTVLQEYDYFNDTLPVLVKQEFSYGLAGKKRSFDGKTTVTYDEFELNPVFPKNYFSNEVGVVIQDAYEKDTSYWSVIRPEPLSKAEQRYQEIQDSIKTAHNRKEYLDSVDKDYNRITWERVLYFGVAHRNRDKKTEWGFGSLLEYFQPVNLGGIRLNPYCTYFKKWKNEKWLNVWPGFSYGVTNNDLVGQGNVTYQYNPMRNAQIQVRGGLDYEAFNPYTSFVTAFQRSNYYKRFFTYIRHEGELLNGLWLRVEAEYADRKPLENFNFGWTGKVTQQWFGNSTAITFEPYQAFISVIRMSYTPFQKFIREPYRKVILGSKWPTLYGLHQKGWSGLLGSDINFDFINIGVEQSFNLLSLGSSRYNVFAGKFLNTQNLRLADYKFFRISDPYFFSNPLRSFQMLNKNLITTRWFIEAHYIHHFTGGFMQKFPVLRKIGLRSTAGAGAMWMEENNYIHAEMFAGLERIFQIGRIRFRLGTYYAIPFTRTWKWYEGLKFSIEFYDNSKGKWRF
jgi:hypothetical protein